MKQYLEFFSENWYLVTTCVCALILAISKIVEFIGYPTQKKLEEIKNRLLFYVTEAEKELGSKTGQIKLALVYDKFCESYPHVKKWISMEKFNALVKEVLPTMRDILNNIEE